MAQQRGYTAGHFQLQIEGHVAAFLTKFSGFAMEADIISNAPGPDNMQKKHVANVKWTPVKTTVGIDMGKALYEWINAAFDKGYVTKNGAIIAADFNYKERSIREFQKALITSLTFPRLDGSSKEPAYFDLEFEAETVRWNNGSGKDIRSVAGPKQKAWLCSNFRFEMGGLPCSRVVSIDSFTWKCAIASDQPDVLREPTKHPAKVTVPDLKLSINMADCPPWAEAAKKWFVDGQHLEEHKMRGRIVFLDSNMKDELGQIEMHNCGFKKFAIDNIEKNSKKIACFNVEFCVEKLGFTLNDFDSPKRAIKRKLNKINRNFGATAACDAVRLEVGSSRTPSVFERIVQRLSVRCRKPAQYPVIRSTGAHVSNGTSDRFVGQDF
jgi:hypothetical protein